MRTVENRQRIRSGVQQDAQIRIGAQLDADPAQHTVTIRNLSAGGVMAEGAVPVMNGCAISIHITPHGWIEGRIAWIQDHRFGIAFAEPIDPAAAIATARADQAPAAAA